MHELTEKIRNTAYPQDVNRMDKIIREYLREKAEEINTENITKTRVISMTSIKQILGLTEEPKTMKKDYDLDDHCPQTGDMVKTPVSGEWCEKKFCACCGNKLA